MARQSLYAPVGNPNNITALPASRPRLTFRSHVNSRWSDVVHLVTVLGVTFLFGLTLYAWIDFMLDIRLVLAAVFFLFLSPHVPRSVSIAIISAMGVAAATVVLQPNLQEMLAFTITALGLMGWLFRSHYASYCRAGWGRFAEHLPPRRGSLLMGFCDAWVQWINYNRHGCAAPGVHKTIAGSYNTRLTVTIAAIMVLSFTFPYLAYCAMLTDGPPPDPWEGWLCALAIAAPVPSIVLACLLISAPILKKSHAIKRASEARALDSCWPALLEDLRTAPDPIERDSLYLGNVESDNAPVLVPLAAAQKHIWAVGGTGSGKTTFLTSLIEQIGYRNDTSIFVGDLKADTYELLATLQWVRTAVARRTGRETPMWTLTNRHGLASHLFSLFHQPQWHRLSVTQKTDVLMAAMSLSFSRSFGESWYSDACYHLLHFVLRKYREIFSFRELAERVAYEVKTAKEHELSRSVKQDGEHVRLVLERLACADAFNQHRGLSSDVTGGALHLGRLFREPCFVYGAFSSLLAPTTSPELLRIMVSAMLTIGTMIEDRTTRVLLVLDEWQRMVAGNLELLLQQARSLGVTVVLANQSVADLQQGSIDLTSSVEANTTVQAWFKDVDQLGIEQLKRFAGMTIDTLQDVSRTDTAQGAITSVTTKEIAVNRFETNEIAAAASRPDTYILRITDNCGYAHYDGLPFVTRYEYHITKAERERRERCAWPAPTGGTILVGQSETAREQPPAVAQSARRLRQGSVLSSGTIGSKQRGRERKR